MSKGKITKTPATLEEAVAIIGATKPKHVIMYSTKQHKPNGCPLVKQVREDAVGAYRLAGWEVYAAPPAAARKKRAAGPVGAKKAVAPGKPE